MSRENLGRKKFRFRELIYDLRPFTWLHVDHFQHARLFDYLSSLLINNQRQPTRLWVKVTSRMRWGKEKIGFSPWKNQFQLFESAIINPLDSRMVDLFMSFIRYSVSCWLVAGPNDNFEFSMQTNIYPHAMK